MKVVIVLPYLKSLGGAGIYGWELAQFLSEQGDNVIVAPLFSDKNLYQKNDSIKLVDIVDESFHPQKLKYWFQIRKIKSNLKKIVLSNNPDVVIFINWPTSMWATNFQNIPVVFSPLDIQILYSDTYTRNLSPGMYWLWNILRPFVRLYEKNQWKYFNKIITISKFVSEHVSKIYDVDSTIIYPGAKQVYFDTSSAKKEKSIFCLGDIKTRNASFLIECAYELSKKRDDFKIWIAGNKNQHSEELKKLVKKYSLENIVTFFGKVSDEKLASLYSQSSVFTHLVNEAPFGIQVVESMATGTPVISWKPGGPEETILDKETGFLIPSFNKKSLILHIEKFLDNPDLVLKMGEKSKKRAIEYFQNKNNYSKIRELLLDSID